MSIPVDVRRQQSTSGSITRHLERLWNRFVVMWNHRVESDGVFLIGTTVQKIKSTATVNYRIGGQMYSKAATDDLFSLVALAATVVPISSSMIVYLCLDAAGAATVLGTDAQLTAALAASPATARYGIPDVPQDKSVVGTAVISTDATHTFTPGTTGLAAAGITVVYKGGPGDQWLPTVAGGNGVPVF